MIQSDESLIPVFFAMASILSLLLLPQNRTLLTGLILNQQKFPRPDIAHLSLWNIHPHHHRACFNSTYSYKGLRGRDVVHVFSKIA